MPQSLVFLLRKSICFKEVLPFFLYSNLFPHAHSSTFKMELLGKENPNTSLWYTSPSSVKHLDLEKNSKEFINNYMEY